MKSVFKGRGVFVWFFEDEERHGGPNTIGCFGISKNNFSSLDVLVQAVDFTTLTTSGKTGRVSTRSRRSFISRAAKDKGLQRPLEECVIICATSGGVRNHMPWC